MTDIKQGVGNATKIFLSLTKHDVRTGEDFPGLGSVSIAAATANQAGAMTAAHVTSLANAKTDITALQSKMRIVQGAGSVVKGAIVYHLDTNRVGIMSMGYDLATGDREVEIQDFYIPAASQGSAGVMTATHVKQLDALRQAVFGGSGTTVQKSHFPLAIEIKRGIDPLILQGGRELVQKGYTSYLFRYSRKRNRTKSLEGIKNHACIRKGWNVVGGPITITIAENGTVGIHKAAFHSDNPQLMLDPAPYLYTPESFVDEKTDRHGSLYVPYGKSKVYIINTQTKNLKKELLPFQ